MKIPLVDLRAQYERIKPEIDQAIQTILNKTSFINGEPVKRFEEELVQFCECTHAIGTSSGSSALFLALKAYGVREGDEVITVPNSFIATAEAIVQCGATPVFVDVKEDTMLMDPTKIEAAITSNTKAIIPVHLYGQICDMDPILEIARENNLVVIEDAAQAIDAEYKGRKLPIGGCATFSFFPAKNLGCYGDGGAVVTNDEEIGKKVAKLKDHGRISKYESDIIGYGARLDALQAAILSVKLKYLPSWSEQRRKNAMFYNQLLAQQAKNHNNSITTPTAKDHSKHVYYMYEVQLENRDRILQALKERGISSGIHYPLPLHLQPSLHHLGYKEGDFPIAEKAAQKILSLPMYPELTKEEIEYIVRNLKEVLEEIKMENKNNAVTYTQNIQANKLNNSDNLFTGKTILVTGGAGFIGSHIVERCLALNAKKVISFDNMCGSENDNLAHLRSNPRLEEVVGDICDYETIKPLVEQADVIFNQAASKLVVSLKDPSIDVKTNVLGNFGILEIMRKCKSQARIIHASTGSVFGSSDKPFDEGDPTNPTTVYGISKLAAEKYFLLYAKEYGIKASVLRYFHVFGPRQDYAGEAGVINIFLSKVLRGQAPQVCGTGEQIRCFTYVQDVVDANLLLYNNPDSIGKAYNIASKTRISIADLAHTIIRKYGEPNNKPEFVAARQGENLRPIPDTSRIEALGFQERVSFDQGLDSTKEWIEEDLERKRTYLSS